jgi:hypothetical protein
VAVYANSWTDLLAGTGRLKFRLPVADYQEEALRSKTQSKMTIATILAGFAGAALIERLLAGMASPLHQFAAFLITVTLALFIATDVGFLALVIEFGCLPLLVGIMIVVMAVGQYYKLTHPRLGTDESKIPHSSVQVSDAAFPAIPPASASPAETAPVPG